MNSENLPYKSQEGRMRQLTSDFQGQRFPWQGMILYLPSEKKIKIVKELYKNDRYH